MLPSRLEHSFFVLFNGIQQANTRQNLLPINGGNLPAKLADLYGGKDLTFAYPYDMI